MKKQLLVTATAFFCGLLCMYGQTKKIAFESHSGNASHWRIALTDEFFGSDESNFGLPSHGYIYEVKKITFLSDTATVVEKRVFEKKYGAPDSTAKFTANRRDTLYNHPVFNRKVSPDSIRNYLRTSGTEYSKTRLIDSIRFKYKPAKKEKALNPPQDKKPGEQLLPAVSASDNNSSSGGSGRPFDRQILYMLLLIVSVSLAGGLAVWKWYQPKLNRQLV